MPSKNPSSETRMHACTYLQEREQYLPKNDPQASVFIRWSIGCIKHNIWVPLDLMIQWDSGRTWEFAFQANSTMRPLHLGLGLLNYPFRTKVPPDKVSCRLWSPLPTFPWCLCPDFHSAMASKLSQLTSLTDVRWSHIFQSPSLPSWLFSHFLPKE